MANKLPKKKRQEIFNAVYLKADEFGYMECDRVKSGQFMDSLVDDPDVGVKLAEHMPKERVRTYIKDTILNRYTKVKKERSLAAMTPEETINSIFGVEASVISTMTMKGNKLDILRSDNNEIFVVSSGTVLKWETALRKALETVANNPTLKVDGKHPSVCLKLSTAGIAMTDADKRLIQYALGIVGVKAIFCDV